MFYICECHKFSRLVCYSSTGNIKSSLKFKREWKLPGRAAGWSQNDPIWKSPLSSSSPTITTSQSRPTSRGTFSGSSWGSPTGFRGWSLIPGPEGKEKSHPWPCPVLLTAFIKTKLRSRGPRAGIWAADLIRRLCWFQPAPNPSCALGLAQDRLPV